jgi:hypothetical protein
LAPAVPAESASSSDREGAAELGAEGARALAVELEAWAVDRENAAVDVDVHGARVARSLARSLRVVARALEASESDPPERREILSRFVELRSDAHRLLHEGAEAYADVRTPPEGTDLRSWRLRATPSTTPPASAVKPKPKRK